MGRDVQGGEKIGSDGMRREIGGDGHGGEERRGGEMGREWSRGGQSEERDGIRREIGGDGQEGVERSEKRGEKILKRRGDGKKWE